MFAKKYFYLISPLLKYIRLEYKIAYFNLKFIINEVDKYFELLSMAVIQPCSFAISTILSPIFKNQQSNNAGSNLVAEQVYLVMITSPEARVQCYQSCPYWSSSFISDFSLGLKDFVFFVPIKSWSFSLDFSNLAIPTHMLLEMLYVLKQFFTNNSKALHFIEKNSIIKNFACKTKKIISCKVFLINDSSLSYPQLKIINFQEKFVLKHVFQQLFLRNISRTL